MAIFCTEFLKVKSNNHQLLLWFFSKFVVELRDSTICPADKKHYKILAVVFCAFVGVSFCWKSEEIA